MRTNFGKSGMVVSVRCHCEVTVGAANCTRIANRAWLLRHSAPGRNPGERLPGSQPRAGTTIFVVCDFMERSAATKQRLCHREERPVPKPRTSEARSGG